MNFDYAMTLPLLVKKLFDEIHHVTVGRIIIRLYIHERSQKRDKNPKNGVAGRVMMWEFFKKMWAPRLRYCTNLNVSV